MAVEHEISTGRDIETRDGPDTPVTPDLIGLPLTAGPLRLARSILRYETSRAIELDHGRARDVVVSAMGCEPGRPV